MALSRVVGALLGIVSAVLGYCHQHVSFDFRFESPCQITGEERASTHANSCLAKSGKQYVALRLALFREVNWCGACRQDRIQHLSINHSILQHCLLQRCR